MISKDIFLVLIRLAWIYIHVCEEPILIMKRWSFNEKFGTGNWSAKWLNTRDFVSLMFQLCQLKVNSSDACILRHMIIMPSVYKA
jgi:hypothetical protein